MKYFLIYNPLPKNPKNMSIQQKIFRKFFYENSSFINNEATFIEITNQRIAKRIGIESED